MLCSCRLVFERVPFLTPAWPSGFYGCMCIQTTRWQGEKCHCSCQGQCCCSCADSKFQSQAKSTVSAPVCQPSGAQLEMPGLRGYELHSTNCFCLTLRHAYACLTLQAHLGPGFRRLVDVFARPCWGCVGVHYV
jgi:hypothetical protein